LALGYPDETPGSGLELRPFAPSQRTLLRRGAKFSDDQALIAMGLCEDMVQKVNVLVDYTETKCIPNLSSKVTNFILLARNPSFAVEASKKAWLIVVIGSVGKSLNDNPSYQADKILFADLSMVKQKYYLTMPAELAKTLQEEVYVGKISVDTMWEKITSTLAPLAIPPKD
jgi:hypothetical protein